MRASQGVTLIELLIVIVVVSIMAAIAIPSYNSFVLKSHRTEAKSALLDLASMEERYFSAQNIYSQNPQDLGYTIAAFPIPSVGNGYYTVNQTGFTPAVAPTGANPGGTPAFYQFTATPIGVQVNDAGCTSFVLDSKGVKTSTGTDLNCWN